jgi:diguanylate cyclase (GGDEF)-like protein
LYCLRKINGAHFLNTPDTHFALSKLIELTKERDVTALELLLAQALFDIIMQMDNNTTRSVVIYNSVDIRRQVFSGFTIGGNSSQGPLSTELKNTLTQCYISGTHCIHSENNQASSTLYPIKNSLGHAVAIIVLDGFICSPQQHKTINMVLQIYQNFTSLINDNERDALTGLLNRKTFELKINKILAQINKVNERKNSTPNPLHFLAIFDIDHFKRVNDDFGHLIGDEVLLLFSQLMTKTFRNTDPLFRFGGEEFIGVFECSNYEDIATVLNRFKENVSSFNFPQVGKVTVSAGYTEISENIVSSHLIDNADQALYHAKNNGRNQICYHAHLVAAGIIETDKKTGDIELF